MRIRTLLMAVCIVVITSALVLGGITYKVLKSACSRSTRTSCVAMRKRGSAVFKAAGAEQIVITTCDNVRLSGFLVQRPQARRVLLVCHGFWQAKEFLYDLIALFPDDTLLFFDFRAHGDSEGSFISFGCHESKDVHAAYNYIVHHKTLGKLPVYGIGFSMGTAALLKAASEGANFKALVLDSGFASLATQTRRLFTRVTSLPVCCFSLTRSLLEYWLQAPLCTVDPVRFLRHLHKTPVLIMHSHQDTVTPVEDAYELYNAAACSKKQLWLVAQASHGKLYTLYPHDYYRQITQFFA